MVAVNEPFISSQVECIVETNTITNNIILQIHDDLNDNDQKVKVKARQIKDIRYWIIKNNLIQFHNNNNDLNNIGDILPPEFKKHKGRVANKRFKSSIEDNKHNTALSDKLI
ncbi:hypothetical protein C1645_813916 [Glomus cerebriforme]|uniref:Uncharacterized protein n=1 Tax=Glomus cerebriforme TaxID=658196 RepID=A0A397TRL3_9GLOM|nr:hypothetical protein C1645_813916 [Glomus cerebriforme]